MNQPHPLDIQITPDFHRAFQLIESGAPFLFITGRAGTGKTTFTQLLKERLKSFAVVAPTGVAALNVGGQTIHSFFRFAPGPIDLSKIIRMKNRSAYQALKTLIIDEISMVRADLLDAIDLFLRKNGPRSTLPFGGVQVIAVGDLFQLPPIINPGEQQEFIERGYDTPFFFSAACLKQLQCQCIEFSTIFRQTEARFIEILNNIREGIRLDQVLPALNERTQQLATDHFNGILLTATNQIADRINSSQLAAIPERAHTYTGEISGDLRMDSNKLPTPMELVLKKGARVMFVKNDRDKQWVNGTLGTVVELGDTFVLVKIGDDTSTTPIRVEADKWESFKYEYNSDKNEVVATQVGFFKQIPLTLAWAVTIHKSQGKTFDRVHIDLGRGAFAAGQVYVALSRCRTLDGVTIENPVRREDIRLNYDVVQFYRGMEG